MHFFFIFCILDEYVLHLNCIFFPFFAQATPSKFVAFSHVFVLTRSVLVHDLGGCAVPNLCCCILLLVIVGIAVHPIFTSHF